MLGLTFIYETLQKMRTKLEDKNTSSIAMFHGNQQLYIKIY